MSKIYTKLISLRFEQQKQEVKEYVDEESRIIKGQVHHMFSRFLNLRITVVHEGTKSEIYNPDFLSLICHFDYPQSIQHEETP